MSKSEEYVPTPQQFRCAEQAADRYKAERDRAVELLREAGDEEWGSVDWHTRARAFLAEVDNA